MSAVNISGTFKRDSRPDNGLEVIADELVKDPMTTRLVVGVIVPHAYKGKAGEELSPTVRFTAIEVAGGEDAVVLRDMLDRLRAARHQQPIQDTLFADREPREAFGSDGFAEPEDDGK